MDQGNEQTAKNLSLFNIFTTPYKTLNNHAITADVLIPKNIQPGKHPLLVRIHGGCLVTGSSSFVGFFASWITEYALSKSAIIVMPNYRLMPEARAGDILDDITDFWAWVVGGDLQAFVSSQEGVEGVKVDVERIWAHGESAGGYLSIQSGLLLPPATVKVISAGFPMLDFKDPWYTTPHSASGKTFFNRPLIPESTIASHLSSLTPDSIVSAVDPLARTGLVMAIGQHGKWREFMGDEERVYPLEAIEKAESFPPLFVFHGREDCVVPVEGTERFVEVFKRAFPQGEILCKVENGDHQFDKVARLEDSWLREGLEFVEREWLA